jgi:hypothetical protein
LYHGRTTPSQTFDLLGDEFSYGFLAATLAALAGGALVLGSWVRKDDLLRRWR